MTKTIDDLINKWRGEEGFEERAGIREFDGNQFKQQAERAAAIEREGWLKSHQGTEIQP
jgi:hypothetical protein